MPKHTKLGTILGKYREAMGLSLLKVSEMSRAPGKKRPGISVSYLSDAELGRRFPTSGKLHILATIYAPVGCTFDELWKARPLDKKTHEAISVERGRVAEIVRDVAGKNRARKSVLEACEEIDQRVGQG